MLRKSLLLFVLFISSVCGKTASATTFFFGQGFDKIDQKAAVTVFESGIGMSLEPTLAGSVFTEEDTRGAGMNARAIAGATDPETDRFNVLGGSLAGQAEGFTFSFAVPGTITELYFDGVKDESFEYFQLETPGGQVFTIFDSQIGDHLLDINSVSEPNVTLLSETNGADDDLFGISIPFQAGDIFTMTYGEYLPAANELVPLFTPDLGNGARFQGVTIAIPEPSTLLIGLAGFVGLFSTNRATDLR